MSILAPRLNGHIEPFATRKPSKIHPQVAPSQASKPSALLQAIIEGFVDGVLILTEQGEWIHSNQYARRICNQLLKCTAQNHSVPETIWHICESLIESRELFPSQRMIIEAEIDGDNFTVFRVRVRWLQLDENSCPYLLVTVEDRSQTTQKTAITEAKKYGLTPREAEVWLLRRANYSYKEIADKLYITLNTVKKHMKNVHAKQQANLWGQEEQQAG